MDRSRKYIVAIAVLTIALTLILLTEAQQVRKVRKADNPSNRNAPSGQRNANGRRDGQPSKEEVNRALQKMLQDRNIKIREGRNAVASTKNGTTLYAVVRNGRVIDYTVVFPQLEGARGVTAKKNSNGLCWLEFMGCMKSCGAGFGLGVVKLDISAGSKAEDCADVCEAERKDCTKNSL